MKSVTTSQKGTNGPCSHPGLQRKRSNSSVDLRSWLMGLQGVSPSAGQGRPAEVQSQSKGGCLAEFVLEGLQPSEAVVL
jgi:hypothetical protein